MITYEVTIICDRCEDNHFSGEPSQHPDVAEVIAAAHKKGWKTGFDGTKPVNICPECVEAAE